MVSVVCVTFVTRIIIKYFTMNRLFLSALAVLTALTIQAQTPKALQVKEMKLKNGMTVWINEDHSQPKVFGAVVVRAGAADCPNTGIAHYFEHIMFKGTDKIGTTNYSAEKVWLDSISAQYDLLAATTDTAARGHIQRHINQLSQHAAQYAIPNDFNNLISRYGGTGLNAATTYDYTYYYNTFSPQYLSQWAALNSERLINPVFRLFQGELETVYEEKNRAADDLFTSAFNRVMGYAFDGTPYAYPVLGSTENLKNPRLSDMYRFYHDYYVAGNMGLILCGDLQTDSLASLLDATFGRIPAGNAPEPRPFAWTDYRQQTYKVQIPIPVVSAELIGFKGPATTSPDADVLTLAMKLLNNEAHTGMLDSLMASGRLMAAIAMCGPMKRAGFVGVGIIPNLLGKKAKAEDICRKEIDRLRRGDFTDEALALAKQTELRSRLEAMEDIAKRAELMVSTFGNGLSWDEYLRRGDRLQHLTRTDIIQVANRYLGDQYMRFVKRYGSADKDRLAQPGYRPVAPRNVGAQSAFAKQLAAMPVAPATPRFVDFDHDAITTHLAPLATLYTVANPVDSLFTLRIIYHKGSRHDHRLEVAEQYIDQLGTSSLSRLQLSQRLQQLGASVSFGVDEERCGFTVRGMDANLRPTLALVQQFMADMQPDEAKLKEVKKQMKVGVNSFDKDKSLVEEAVLGRIMYGAHSDALTQPSVKEVAAMTSAQLIQSVRDAARTETSIVYSGTLPSATVAEAVRETLSPAQAVERHTDVHLTMEPVTENTVYIYQIPDARQTLIGTYQPMDPTPTVDAIATRKLMATCLGRGMSSLMFQELREFRSFAYSAYAYSVESVHALHPNDPTALITTMGTQADKTLQALGVLDSLLAHATIDAGRVGLARSVMANSLNTSYPSFRAIGDYIATRRIDGYTHDLNAEVYRALLDRTPDEVAAYYRTQVQPGPRAVYLIGNITAPMRSQLARYGRVVVLTKRDVLNY